MPWDNSQIQERLDSGAQAARDQSATEHKQYGQTSETVYPYTYWWIKGFNDAIDAGS
ncbi:hypothetical protein MINTM005_13440 [Mycobacterium intracellulare]|uniref:hypothetical protein n=1 Tax=Mycobacterium intracellulare TaxID=1767 RepID=UPI001927DDF0|nr:hypothetical protein [Mycobacterium intracellulare]BCO56100.1 hypothetical protein MINTM005_13440 [Mycobacterium intracellulare]